MKRLILFFFLAFTVIQLHGQEVEIIEPCTHSGVDDCLYGRGFGYGTTPERAKSDAYVCALKYLASSIGERVQLNGQLSLFSAGTESLYLSDTFEKASLKMDKIMAFTVSGESFHTTFINWNWVRFASTSSKIDIVCEDIQKVKNEDGDYKAACLVRLKEKDIEGILYDYNTFVRRFYE